MTVRCTFPCIIDRCNSIFTCTELDNDTESSQKQRTVGKSAVNVNQKSKPTTDRCVFMTFVCDRDNYKHAFRELIIIKHLLIYKAES